MQGFLKWVQGKADSVYQGIVGTLEAVGAVAHAVAIFATSPDLQRNFANRLFEFSLGTWRAVSPFNYLDLVRRPETRAVLLEGMKRPLRRLAMAVGYRAVVRPGLRRLVNAGVTEDPILTEVVMLIPDVISIAYFTNRMIDGRADGMCYNLAMSKASADEVVQEAFRNLQPYGKKVIPDEYKGLSQKQLLEKLMQDPKKFEKEYGLSPEHKELLGNPMLGPCSHDLETRGSATFPSTIHYLGTAVLVKIAGLAAMGASQQYGAYADFAMTALFVGRTDMEYALSNSCMEHRLEVMNRNNTYALGFGAGVMALGYGVDYAVMNYGVRFAVNAAARLATGQNLDPQTLDAFMTEIKTAGYCAPVIAWFAGEPISSMQDLHGIMVTNLNRTNSLPGTGYGVDVFKPFRALTDTVQNQVSEWMAASPATVDWNELLHSKPARAGAWMFINPSLQVWSKPVYADGKLVERDGWDLIAMRGSSRMFLKYYGNGIIMGLADAREKSRYIPYKVFNGLNKWSPFIAGLFASEDDRAKLAMINKRQVKDTMDTWKDYLVRINSDAFMPVEGELVVNGENSDADFYQLQNRVPSDVDMAKSFERQMSMPPPMLSIAPPSTTLFSQQNEQGERQKQESTVRRRQPSASMYSSHDVRKIPDLEDRAKQRGLQDDLLKQMSMTSLKKE